MRILQNLSIALGGISTNKLRSALTMLGIIIGVAAVIVLMSIGNGTTASITSRISSLGSNLIFIRPGTGQAQGGVRQAQGSSTSLTLQDAQALGEPGAIPSVAAVAVESQSRAQLVFSNQNMNTSIRGVDENYLTVRNYQLADGDFFTKTNLDQRSLLVVLGATPAATLFPDGDAVGKTIKINQLNYKVAGLLVSKGGSGFGNDDDVAMIPITTFQTRLSSQRTNQGGQTVQTINVQVIDEKHISEAKADLTALLEQRHRITDGQDDFTITSQEDTLATLNQVTGVMTAFLGSIAGISLLVGGIGIMNIMLVSVTERTREIGIRKAIGAKRSDILSQFLVEAMVLSLCGGGGGLALGLSVSAVVGKLNLNGQPMQTVVSPEIAVLAVGVSAAIGLFFGIYPAMQASKLNPIQALRYE